MDALHRIVSGGPKRRAELIAAGVFVLIWFGIDIIQFSDWVLQKFNPPETAICLPVLTSIPLTQNNGLQLLANPAP
jgi:hypothetical protein